MKISLLTLGLFALIAGFGINGAIDAKDSTSFKVCIERLNGIETAKKDRGYSAPQVATVKDDKAGNAIDHGVSHNNSPKGDVHKTAEAHGISTVERI